MTKRTAVLSLVLLLALLTSAFADRVEISGRVVEASTGNPLQGANIVVQGAMAGAATDDNGRFSFTYDANQDFIIVVRFMGYKTQERELSPNASLSNLVFEMEEHSMRIIEIIEETGTGGTGKGEQEPPQVAEETASIPSKR